MKPIVINFRTKCFGIVPEGEIIKGFLLIEGVGGSLLFFPPDKDGCGCLIWAILAEDGIYEDREYVSGGKKENWVNLGEGKIDPSFSKFLKTLKPDMLVTQVVRKKKLAKPRQNQPKKKVEKIFGIH